LSAAFDPLRQHKPANPCQAMIRQPDAADRLRQSPHVGLSVGDTPDLGQLQ